MASAVSFANAMDSDFVEKRATNCCFLLSQDVTPFANKNLFSEDFIDKCEIQTILREEY